jgi:hypothetical protein
MTSTTTTDVRTAIDNAITDDQYSPYGLIKAINPVLEELELKVLPTQMGYNYDRNGLITGTKGVKKYTKVQVREWAYKYITRKMGA